MSGNEICPTHNGKHFSIAIPSTATAQLIPWSAGLPCTALRQTLQVSHWWAPLPTWKTTRIISILCSTGKLLFLNQHIGVSITWSSLQQQNSYPPCKLKCLTLVKGQDTQNLAMIPMTNTGFLNITWQSDKHLVNVAQTSLADLPTCHMQGIKINAQQTLKQLCDITCTNKTKHCLYGCIHYMLHDFLVSGIVLQQLLLEILRKASLWLVTPTNIKAAFWPTCFVPTHPYTFWQHIQCCASQQEHTENQTKQTWILCFVTFVLRLNFKHISALLKDTAKHSILPNRPEFIHCPRQHHLYPEHPDRSSFRLSQAWHDITGLTTASVLLAWSPSVFLLQPQAGTASCHYM